MEGAISFPKLTATAFPICGLKSIFETDFKRHSEPRLPSTAQILTSIQ